MEVIIKVRHTEVSNEVKEYSRIKVLEKCSQYLDESDQLIICEIELDDQFGNKGGKDKRVDITISLPHQHLPIHIEESEPTFQEAINKAIDRLDQVLTKYKEIRQ